MTSVQNLFFRVLCFRDRAGDEEVWVAFCLERDIAAQGDTSLDATRDLRHVIAAELQIDKDYAYEGEPLSRIKPAPQKYWEMWEQAKAPREDSVTHGNIVVHLSIRTL